jgi:hypothetical protein
VPSAKGPDCQFLRATVRAGLRRHVSDNDKADRAADRFLSQVDRSAGPDACWPWTGGIGTDGYGMFAFGGRTIGAHRIACMLAHGEPPAHDSQACHDPARCKSRLCCNPAHLRWDSPAGNQHDVRITLTRRGERNPKAKLTEVQVRAIWAERGKGGYIAISARLGLPFRAVRRVLDGTNWGWLTGATALLLLVLSAVGCHESACAEKVVDITPAECKALCSPRYVYSWTVNSCVCDGPREGDEKSDGAQ